MKLYLQKRNGFWRARVTWTDAEGKRHERNETTPIECSEDDNRGNKRAEEWLEGWARKLNLGQRNEQRRNDDVVFVLPRSPCDPASYGAY